MDTGLAASESDLDDCGGGHMIAAACAEVSNQLPFLAVKSAIHFHKWNCSKIGGHRRHPWPVVFHNVSIIETKFQELVMNSAQGNELSLICKYSTQVSIYVCDCPLHVK
jgi:hypothetical protein